MPRTPDPLGDAAIKRHEANPLGLTRDELESLANDIVQEIDASENAKGDLSGDEGRWARNMQLYELDPTCTNLDLVPGMSTYPIPLWKPKADRIIGSIHKAVTGIEPYVQFIPNSQSAKEKGRSDRLTKALQTVATYDNGRFGFDRAFRMSLKQAINTGVCILYIHPVPGGQIRFECIAPDDFCAYSHEQIDIAEMKTVGHRFYPLRSQVDQRVDEKTYMPFEVGAEDTYKSTGSDVTDFRAVVQTQPQRPTDDKIEFWQIVRKCRFKTGKKRVDGSDEYGPPEDWIFIIAKSAQKIMRMEKLDYSTGRLYFDIRMDESYGTFWPQSSPGNDMQGLQLIYSDLINVVLQGAYAAAFPGVALIGATLDAKVKRWGPGTVWELPTGASVQVVNNQFNGQYLVELIPLLEKLADAMSRVSQLGVTQNLPSHTTAMAASGILQAQNEGKDQYTSFVIPVIGEIFIFLKEILTRHWDDVHAYYGDLGLKNALDLQVQARAVPTGKSQISSPQTIFQKIAILMQLAENPNSTLSYQECEKQAMHFLDLPFNVDGLLKVMPSPQELGMVLQGLLNWVQGGMPEQGGEGMVTPQEASMFVQEIQQGAQKQAEEDGGDQGEPGGGALALLAGGSIQPGAQQALPHPHAEFPPNVMGA